MVDTRTEMRYNGLASGEALRNAQTIPHKFGEKGEYTHMKRKSAIAAVTAAALALSLAACGSSDAAAASSAAPVESTASSEAAPAGDFDTDQDIMVISREDGSGTRGAFIELTGVEEKNADGKKVDNTTEAAAIQSSTNGVMTAVANDETAIGYISLGSLNDTVKAVTVGGVAASAETVKDGSYVLARPFNIVTNGDATDPVAVDFIAYVLSKDGQALATDKGYIGEDGADFTSAQPAGKITVGGSSSVSPLMEKLIEAYKTVNPNAELELLTTDSTTGVSGALDGTYTIGMASRELKDSEVEGGAKATVLALDGIAVVVNPANTTEDLTVDQIKGIYTGELTIWADVQ
jgi:phosphate transport system substrate-binding protein